MLDYWSTTLAPGYEWPNGQTLTTGNYPEYFAALGSYVVPDMRGMAGIVLDNLGGSARGLYPNGYITSTTLGATGGVDGASLVAGNIPAHAHNVYFNDATHSHNFINNGSVMGGVYTDQSQCYVYQAGGGQGCQSYYTTIQGSTTGCSIGSAPGTNNSTTTSVGSGTNVSHMQPSTMIGKLLVVE
jgi:microcystin-dependent protein